MRLRGLILSVALHAGLFGMISQAKDREPVRMPTAIRVASQEPPPPRPPPPDPVEPPPVEESAAPAEPPPPQPKPPKKTPEPKKPPPEPAADSPALDTGAPVDLGTMMSNEGGEGPALNMAGPGEKVPAEASKPEPEQPKPKPKKQAQACDEEPSKPVPVSKTAIGYPPEARAQGVEGQVVLRAFIDENGRVENVVVVRSAGPLIDGPVAAELKNWQFDPAVACGKRVKATFTIARRFELGG